MLQNEKKKYFLVKLDPLLRDSYQGNITTHPEILTQSPGEPHSDVRMSFGSDHRPPAAFVWLSRAKVRERDREREMVDSEKESMGWG